MEITIKHPGVENKKIKALRFPRDEKTLYEISNELGIEITTDSNCYIVEADDKDFLRILPNNLCNIDELNYLMKRLDGLMQKEIDTFYAVAFAEEPKTMAELINLSFNMHCYSLVTDFSDFNKVGKDLYLSERQAVATRELDELDGELYAMEIIKNNPHPRITPYGVLYKSSNQPDQVYNGRHFPPYEWQENMATVELKTKDESEFIYLPCSDVEIGKALMRLGVPYLQDCEVEIDSHNFPDNVLGLISSDTTSIERVDMLNNLANKFKGIGTRAMKQFEKLMDHVNPRTTEEVFSLVDSMYEFELFDGIKDIESYGRFMICESGHFEYDSNLEEYVDFKRYGREKMSNEVGAFSSNGYIIYHGYNQHLSNILSKNLGMKIPEIKEQRILKLYMPLKIATYDIENEYGYRETLNEPLQLQSYDVVDYLDDILDAIEKNNFPEEKERGLMHYYDEHDSVNAKVAKYEFSVEMVDEELMGVAILTLNGDLNTDELNKIKDYVTCHASDGWGESFEQREISTDMGDVYISFWNGSNDWSIKTVEEMGIAQPTMRGIKFEY